MENCQVGIFAAYASRYGYAFLDKHLFMPEKWFTDEYEVRRKKCKVPEDLEFKTNSKIARNLNDFSWYRRKVFEGTKGPIECEFSKREVILSKGGLPWKTVWLVMKRTVGRNPIYIFYISDALRSTRLKTFFWFSGIRWAIEQCFEETKTELGMDQYEVRKFPGWNHHMLTRMPAHFFLWHLKIRLGEKVPAVTLSQLRRLSENVLSPRLCVMVKKLFLEYQPYACGNFFREP